MNLKVDGYQVDDEDNVFLDTLYKYTKGDLSIITDGKSPFVTLPYATGYTQAGSDSS